MPYYAGLSAQLPAVSTPQAQRVIKLPIVSSSPIAGAGREDTRAVVKEFFKWIVEQQPEEDVEEYLAVAKVAIAQRWTMKDIKEMALPSSDMYHVAVKTFNLKDGVVRHLKDEIPKFKRVYRAANGLAALGGGV